MALWPQRERGLFHQPGISQALPVTGKVNFYRANIQQRPDSLAGDGVNVSGRPPHVLSGGSVCP
jgi:hypothetical protein